MIGKGNHTVVDLEKIIILLDLTQDGLAKVITREGLTLEHVQTENQLHRLREFIVKQQVYAADKKRSP